MSFHWCRSCPASLASLHSVHTRTQPTFPSSTYSTMLRHPPCHIAQLPSRHITLPCRVTPWHSASVPVVSAASNLGHITQLCLINARSSALVKCSLPPSYAHWPSTHSMQPPCILCAPFPYFIVQTMPTMHVPMPRSCCTCVARPFSLRRPTRCLYILTPFTACAFVWVCFQIFIQLYLFLIFVLSQIIRVVILV